MPDPYRWLEDDVRGSKEVADWVAAENKVTLAYLEAIPQRETIRRRLTELWNFAQYSSPFKEGGRYYYLKNDGLQNQAVLYVMDSLDGQAAACCSTRTRGPRTARSPWPGWASATTARYLAYCRAEAGSDWSTWHVLEIASRQACCPTSCKWTKFSDASWTKDGKGFFYSRYDEPKKGAEFQALNFNNKLYYHRLGTPQSDDVLVYYRPDHPEWHYDGDGDRRRPLPGHHHRPWAPTTRNRVDGQGPDRARTRCRSS